MASDTRTGAPTTVVHIETDQRSAHRIGDLIAERFDGDAIAVSLVDIGARRWRVSVHFQTRPDRTSVRALTAVAGSRKLRFERVAAKDWVSDSLAGLKPVQAGRFVVHGAHDRARIPQNRLAIEIEAALAFGTGHHGTTRGCLLALDRICKLRSPRRKPRVLDLGTGSGVLAIAAARALHRPVLAIDIDPSSVRAARANARLNRAGAMVRIVQGNGVTGLRGCGPFELVFANILLAPLQRLAAPLRKFITPGGRIVLSGLLSSQANAAMAAYRGLALERRIDLEGWTTLVLMRRGRPDASVAGLRRSP